MHPARYEAYGLAVHEALCRGLPALVSASAGVAERYPADLAAAAASAIRAARRSSTARLLAWRADADLPHRVGAVRVEAARAQLGPHGAGHRWRSARGPRVIGCRSWPTSTHRPCWVCGGAGGDRFHEAVLEFNAWREQDPELAAYTGETIWLRRCARAASRSRSAFRRCRSYFERMYDQRWSPEWVAQEFESTYKDVIFTRILAALGERVTARPRALLDIGSHAGRFLQLAAQAGWHAEGTEINPRTAAYAAERTGATVHRVRAEDVDGLGRTFRRRDADRRARAHSGAAGAAGDRAARARATAAGSR